MDFFHAQNISSDHPAVEILRDLEATTYHVDKNILGQKFDLALHIFDAILRWAEMLKCRLKVGVPYVL